MSFHWKLIARINVEDSFFQDSEVILALDYILEGEEACGDTTVDQMIRKSNGAGFIEFIIDGKFYGTSSPTSLANDISELQHVKTVVLGYLGDYGLESIEVHGDDTGSRDYVIAIVEFMRDRQAELNKVYKVALETNV